MTDCLICKRHYSQGGRCCENRKNFLGFEKEPRGKMIRTSLTFYIDSRAETSFIKYGEKIRFDDNGQTFEMVVVKINWINLEKMVFNVDVDYHETEMPTFEKKKKFKIIRA